MANELLTRKDLARELSVDPNTVERMANDGRIPAPINLGTETKKLLRWRRSEFDAWLATGCKPVSAEPSGAAT